MAEKKAFLLRLDPAVHDALLRLSQRELRSVNAQIEYLLRDGLARRGIPAQETSAEPADTPGAPPANG